MVESEGGDVVIVWIIAAVTPMRKAGPVEDLDARCEGWSSELPLLLARVEEPFSVGRCTTVNHRINGG